MTQKIQKFGSSLITPILLFTFSGLVISITTILNNVNIVGSIANEGTVWRKLGMKRTVLIGLLITGFSGMFPVFSQSFHLILTSRCFLGVGLGLLNTSAVRYIGLLFEEEKQAILQGYRSAAELIGQSLMTIVAGWLFIGGWNMSFLVYGVAIVIAVLFYFIVPEIEEIEAKETPKSKEKLPKLIYLLAVFMGVTIFSNAAILIRFPAMAVQIQGEGYNSSTILALNPIIGIFSAAVYGKLYEKIGRHILYAGLLILSVSNLLIGYSNGNFAMLTTGFLLVSIVSSWLFPFILMLVAKKTTTSSQNFAMSLIFAATNLSIFLTTPILIFIERLVGSQALMAPYPVIGMGLLVMIPCISLGKKKIIQYV